MGRREPISLGLKPVREAGKVMHPSVWHGEERSLCLLQLPSSAGSEMRGKGRLQAWWWQL